MGNNRNRLLQIKISDELNFIVVQCDYFGYCYMQVPSQEERIKLLENSINIKPFNMTKEGLKEYIYTCSLNETVEDMNDRGVLQAVDNMTAVLYVLKNIKERGFSINIKKWLHMVSPTVHILHIIVFVFVQIYLD